MMGTLLSEALRPVITLKRDQKRRSRIPHYDRITIPRHLHDIFN